MESETTVVEEQRAVNQNTEEEEKHDERPPALVLRLRSTSLRPLRSSLPKRRVTFTADTVDNEHLGRLKSNWLALNYPFISN